MTVGPADAHADLRIPEKQCLHRTVVTGGGGGEGVLCGIKIFPLAGGVVTKSVSEDSQSLLGMETRHHGIVQLLSGVGLFATPWTAACQPSLSFTNSWSMLKPMSIELVMPSNYFIHCHLLLPTVFPRMRAFPRIFSNDSVLRIRWPKCWSFSFNNSPSNGYSGLNSFRMDWLDLPAVQGTLKSLLQHHSSKASIL